MCTGWRRAALALAAFWLGCASAPLLEQGLMQARWTAAEGGTQEVPFSFES